MSKNRVLIDCVRRNFHAVARTVPTFNSPSSLSRTCVLGTLLRGSGRSCLGLPPAALHGPELRQELRHQHVRFAAVTRGTYGFTSPHLTFVPAQFAGKSRPPPL